MQHPRKKIIPGECWPENESGIESCEQGDSDSEKESNGQTEGGILPHQLAGDHRGQENDLFRDLFRDAVQIGTAADIDPPVADCR